MYTPQENAQQFQQKNSNDNNNLKLKLHLAKLARDSVERGRSEDLKAVTKRAQAREEELTGVITDMEDQHCKYSYR